MPDIQTIATLLSTPQQSGSEFLTAEEQRRILAFQQLQKMAGATNMPIYSKGTGMLKVATGALGGFLEGQTERNAQAAQAANSAALMKHFMGDPALSGGQSSTFGGINPVLPPIQTSSVSPAASGGGPDFSGGPDMSGGADISAAPMPVADTASMGAVPGMADSFANMPVYDQAEMTPLDAAVATPQELAPVAQNGIYEPNVLNPIDAAVASPVEKYRAGMELKDAPPPALMTGDVQPAPVPAPLPMGAPTATPLGAETARDFQALPTSPISPAVPPGDMNRGTIFNAPPASAVPGLKPPIETEEVSPRSEEAPPRPPADIPYKNASDITNPRFMKAVAAIESGGDPNAVTGSYKGKYQLSESEFRRYGGQGSIFDPAENTRVAKLKIADEANELAQKLGRPVTEADVYLAHQQGVGGATAHLTHPERKAWESMYSTGEGQEKGPGWAKQAIWGNIPDAAKRQFGSVDNVTSGQFANLWRQRYEREVGKDSGTPATATQTATGSPQPQAGPSPQVLAQSLQNPSQTPTMSRERLAEALRLASDPRTPKAMQSALMGEITRQTTQPMPVVVNGRLVNPRNGALIKDLRDPADIESKNLDLQVKRKSLESKPTYGVIGKDQFGNEQYGWIDPRSQSITPTAAPTQQGDGVIPPPPAGVDPKVWRREQSERFTRGSLPASFEDESKLRGEFQQLPSYKNITQALPVYKSMVDAAGRNDRGSDVNLIYGFAKVMDPTSVVRESEMSVAQAIATMPEQLQQSIKSQLGNGGRLSPETRQQIMTEAQSRVQSYKSMYDNDAGMFGEVAKQYHANPERVIPKFGEIPLYKPSELKTPTAPASVPDRAALEAEARKRGLLK